MSKVRFYSIILLCCIVGTVYVTVSLETYTSEPVAIWEELENPWRDTSDALHDIAFLNSSHGWATGKGDIGTGIGEGSWGVVLQTKDGGDTWNLSYSNHLLPSFIEIVDSDTVWIATSRGLLNTSDGGRTWYLDTPEHVKSDRVRTVAFKNSTHGWTSRKRELLYTVDGGNIWMPVESWSFFGAWINQIRFVGEHLMWAGGYDGIFHSQDGGQTWTRQSRKSTMGLAIVNDTEGWACYLSSHFSHMTDGQNWIEQRPPSRVTYSWSPSQYIDLEFINPKQGWMVGSYVGVAYTPDGGLNWYEQELPIGWRGLKAVDFINETHGWAVGWDGVIYRTRTGNQYGKRLVGEGYVIRGLFQGGWVIPISTGPCVYLVSFCVIASLELVDIYQNWKKSRPSHTAPRIQ